MWALYNTVKNKNRQKKTKIDQNEQKKNKNRQEGTKKREIPVVAETNKKFFLDIPESKKKQNEVGSHSNFSNF
jgi:hypothetical protein